VSDGDGWNEDVGVEVGEEKLGADLLAPGSTTTATNIGHEKSLP
jgi:hypothetical protein